MSPRKPISVALVAVVVSGMFGALPAPVGAARKAEPVVVAKDDTGDWGNNQADELGPVGGPLGSDLVQASISRADAKTLDFVIKVTELPQNGGVPEFVRYVWTMTVNNELVRLDGKWTDYTRATCSPSGGTCPPPRDPGEAPFLVQGNCGLNQTGTSVTCEELGLVHATFDPAAATITVPVPLKLIKAKPGAKIRNGTTPGSGFSGVLAIPMVGTSQGDMPKDEMIITKTYVVSKK